MPIESNSTTSSYDGMDPLEQEMLEQNVTHMDRCDLEIDRLEALLASQYMYDGISVEEQLGVLSLLLDAIQGISTSINSCVERIKLVASKYPGKTIIATSKLSKNRELGGLLRLAMGKRDIALKRLRDTEALIRKLMENGSKLLNKKKQQDILEEETAKRIQQQSYQIWQFFIRLSSNSEDSSNQNSSLMTFLRIGAYGATFQLFILKHFAKGNFLLLPEIFDYTSRELDELSEDLDDAINTLNNLNPHVIFETPQNLKEFLKKTRKVSQIISRGDMCSDIIQRLCMDNETIIQNEALQARALELVNRQHMYEDKYSNAMERVMDSIGPENISRFVDAHVRECEQKFTTFNLETTQEFPRVVKTSIQLSASSKTSEHMIKYVQKLRESTMLGSVEHRKLTDIKTRLTQCLIRLGMIDQLSKGTIIDKVLLLSDPEHQKKKKKKLGFDNT